MMKKILTFLIALVFSTGLFAQFTTLNAGGTWATARGIINSNFVLAATLANPTFTGTVTLPASWKIGIVTVTATGTQLNFVDATSSIQTQFNTKEPSLGNPGTSGWVLSSTNVGVRSWVAQSGGYTNLTSFVTQTNWRLFYSNGSGDVTELALGADGTYLKSNGASAAPTFDTPAGAGDMMVEDSTGNAPGNYMPRLQTANLVHDSIDVYIASAEVGIALADSNIYDEGYQTPRGTDIKLALKLNKADSVGGGSGTYTSGDDFRDGQALKKAYLDVMTIVTFAVGGNNAADTTAITDSTILGSFYNGGAKSIVVDTLRAVMKHGLGNDTLAFNIVWGKDFRNGPTGHLSNTQFNCGRTTKTAYTNLTTGNFFSAFDHTTIPPGVTVYGILPYHPADALKRKPRYFEVSLIGHYQ